MSRTSLPIRLLEVVYAAAASEYMGGVRAGYRSHPEHYAEANRHARQREITLASFALVRSASKGFHYFSDLLLQYRRRKKVRSVAPDGMVVRSEKRLEVEASYDISVQPARPFWVLDYMSERDNPKDYPASYEQYEKELRIPYYLAFYLDRQELALFRNVKGHYSPVDPAREGRYAIPELEIEVGLLAGWMRFWYRRELLPLPEQLWAQNEQLQRKLEDMTIRALTAEAALALTPPAPLPPAAPGAPRSPRTAPPARE